MSAAPDSKPCPFCGELIRLNAIKCRFCGEFLDGSAQPTPQRSPAAASTDPGAIKWVVPVGRNLFAMAAGYFGVLALIPYPFLIFSLFPENARRNTLKNVLYLGAGLNGVMGFLAIVLGIGAIVLVLQGGKKGLGRAIFAVLAGLAGGIGYGLAVVWFIEKFIG